MRDVTDVGYCIIFWYAIVKKFVTIKINNNNKSIATL